MIWKISSHRPSSQASYILEVRLIRPLKEFHFNDTVTKMEKPLTYFGVGLLFALIFYCLSLASITPTNYTFSINHTNSHPDGYAALSENPFARESALFNRLLTPLLSHYVHVRGDNFVYTPLVIGLFFLALVYAYFRKTGATPAISIAGLAIMAFSCPITTMFAGGGIPDTTSYFFVMLAVLTIDAKFWGRFWGLWLAFAMLNHESNIIYVPFLAVLAYFSCVKEKRLTRVCRIALNISIPLVIFAVWRYYSRNSAGYPFAFYLSKGNLMLYLNNCTMAPLGFFMAFKLFWVVPIAAVYVSLSEKKYAFVINATLLVISTFSLLLIAADYSRLAAACFVLVLLSINVIRNHMSDKMLQKLLWFLIVVNFFFPQYNVGQGIVILSPPLPVSYSLYKLTGQFNFINNPAGVKPIFIRSDYIK